MNHFQLLLILTTVTGCTLASTTRTSTYKEDLTAYRINYDELINDTSLIEDPDDDVFIDTTHYTLIAEDEVTGELNSLLDSISSLRISDGWVTGYTIQVYTGRNKEEATSMKNRVYRVLPDSRPLIIFDSPNFEVKVGQYYSKFEAHKDFAALKKTFPTTIIIPERIRIEHEPD